MSSIEVRECAKEKWSGNCIQTIYAVQRAYRRDHDRRISREIEWLNFCPEKGLGHVNRNRRKLAALAVDGYYLTDFWSRRESNHDQLAEKNRPVQTRYLLEHLANTFTIIFIFLFRHILKLAISYITMILCCYRYLSYVLYDRIGLYVHTCCFYLHEM